MRLPRFFPLVCVFLAACADDAPPALPLAEPPNILIAISDDQSWIHTGAYGSPFVETPAFDRVAEEGILFTQAFVTSPGCAPSRASMVLGRYPWQNEHAGNHNSLWPAKYKPLPDYLAEAGYHVGYTGKGVGPFHWALAGRYTNPAGPEYNAAELDPPHEHMNDTDYAENFQRFLDERTEGQPFFFWFGATEPHRRYEIGAGLDEGKQLADAVVPPFLPDADTVRIDLLDYAVEIEWFDRHLGRMLEMLERAGELDNTLVLVTSDNGMPFPAAKANAYEYGIHVPLAVRWGAYVAPGRVVDDLVSLVDLTPTLFELIGIAPPEPPDTAPRTEQTFSDVLNQTAPPVVHPFAGRSFSNLLFDDRSGIVDSTRDAVYAGRERHSSSRWANLGYPQRAIRTHDYLYIRNYRPERWPAGAPQKFDEDSSLTYGYHDLDWSPTTGLSNAYLVRNRNEPGVERFAEHALGHRSAEELYAVREDPGCMTNLAADPSYADVRAELADRLEAHLRATGDARVTGSNPDVFETYPRFAGIRPFPRPVWADTMDAAEVARLAALSDTDRRPMRPPASIDADGLTAGPWTLVRRGDAWALYDTAADPDRRTDLNRRMPRVVSQLARLHREYWKE